MGYFVSGLIGAFIGCMIGFFGFSVLANGRSNCDEEQG